MLCFLQTIPQLDGAYEYLKKVGSEPVDKAAFEEAAGVGIVISPEQITAAVADAINSKKEQLVEERWVAGLGPQLHDLLL